MRTRIWTTTVVLSLALSGCALPGIGQPAEPSPAAPVDAPPGKPAEPGAQEPAGATEPGATPGATLGTGAEQSAEVAVLGLKRRGKLMDLVLSFTLRSRKGIDYISLNEIIGSGPTTVTLVDNVNLKRYLVVKDSKGQLLQPAAWVLKAGEPTARTYTFAAPADDITALDVSIGDWPPIRDVPVTS